MVEDAETMLSRNDVFGALGTSRAVRRFAPNPVPTETIEALVWAATRAASPENDQPWEFVVVTDPGRGPTLVGWWRPRPTCTPLRSLRPKTRACADPRSRPSTSCGTSGRHR